MPSLRSALLHFPLAAACAAPLLAQAPAKPADEPRPVVLITVEGLRVDHTSGAGYVRPTTPALAAFERGALVLTRAYTTASASVPAHLSVLTGLDAAQHGVSAFGVLRTPFANAAGRKTAAELAAAAGYRTAAFVASPALGKGSGLAAGFALVDEPESGVRPAAELAARAGKWLELCGKERFFLWLAFDGGCEPNLPPPEFAARFAADAKIDALLDARGIDPAKFELGFSKLLQIRMFFPDMEARVTPRQELPLPTIDRDVFRRMYDRYDADLCATDAALGSVLARLDELGLRERCVVAFAGVYGQSLGDRQELGHGEVVREQVLVPVALRAAGLVPARSDALASLVDVLPTAFELAHAAPAEALAAQGAGRDLLAPGFQRDAALVRRPTREKEKWDPGPIWALYTRDFKYVYRPQLTDELYDLAADPQERANVIKAHAELAATLLADLRARIGEAK